MFLRIHNLLTLTVPVQITVSKTENFAAWYQEIVLKAEMIEYYNEISGFFVLRPTSMYIWNVIRKWFSERIEAMDVEECSFPMFLSSKSLEKEKEHGLSLQNQLILNNISETKNS